MCRAKPLRALTQADQFGSYGPHVARDNETSDGHPVPRRPQPREVFAKPANFGSEPDPALRRDSDALDLLDVLRARMQSRFVYSVREMLGPGEGKLAPVADVARRLDPLLAEIKQLNRAGSRRAALFQLEQDRQNARGDFTPPESRRVQNRRRYLRRKLEGIEWMTLDDFALWQALVGVDLFMPSEEAVDRLVLPERLGSDALAKRIEDAEAFRASQLRPVKDSRRR